MLFGNIAALTQTDVKRILAYSSIGQVGYMIIGLAVALPSGLEGTFVQFFNHALMKGSAFLCIGAIIYRLGARDLSSIKGVGYRMPITAFAFTISLFALTGLPPLNGFPGELILFSSTIEANMAWLGVALLLNSIISAGFYLRIVFALIQQDTSQKITKIKEAPLLLLVPICILSILIIVFGIWPDPVVNFAKQAVDAIISMGA
jgi:formate hydrogenlyase subunit 3/multisubunit Na+/H+ antiporter MnhD subunit